MKTFNHSNCVMRRGFTDRLDEKYIPDLIFLQKESFEEFICLDNNDEEKREKSRLQDIFKTFFPIYDNTKTVVLEFIKYRVGEVKYTVKECLNSGRNFSIPVYATLRLIIFTKPDENGKKDIKVIKEQEVFLCDLPIMTRQGSFVINGIERVVVSQMRRAPGVFFDSEKSKISSGKNYTAKIIPITGSWLDFEFDGRDLFYFRIDKKRKLSISYFFKILGIDLSEVLKYFYKNNVLKFSNNQWISEFNSEGIVGKSFEYDIIDAETNEVVIPKNKKITKLLLKKLKDKNFKNFVINENYISSYILSENIFDENGDVLLPVGISLNEDKLNLLKDLNISEINVVNPEDSELGPYIYNTIIADKDITTEGAFCEIYRSIRVGEEAPNFEAAEKFVNNLLFSSRYNLSEVGRMKANYRLGVDIPLTTTCLTKDDILSTIKILSKIKHNDEKTDDIDNLMNRRLRAVGELIDSQFRIGLARIERTIIEKMNSVDPETIMPQNLINAKPLISAILDFFCTSQLSQFMDQTNPLSEIGHKRRISALGPGGLTRERAGFEVRDVHPTHYGRLCPLESPDGGNIGLINSMSLFAKTNKYGFIETPYKKVVNGVVTDEVKYLSAIEEAGHAVAQHNVRVDENGKILDELVACRKDGETLMLPPESIDFIDISSRQLVSVAANLVPFIENDDSKRATMGSNMMKQAVPLLKTEAPYVGTGLEHIVAMNASSVLTSEVNGIVRCADANRIIIEEKQEGTISKIHTYNLDKYLRTNNDTVLNQYPIVKAGQYVHKGEILADSQNIDGGELALGKNVLVGFATYDGFNYEDSILISERLVKEGTFTSLHLEEFEVVARDTRLGPEEITRDIPNISSDLLKKLDETGIIYIGAHIKAGDILVGKTTPKGESPMTPEEKLLKVIFGEKVADVRDSSLYVPPSVVSGTVIDVKIYTRNGLDKDQRAMYIDSCKIDELARNKNKEIALLRLSLYEKIKPIILDKELEKTVEKVKKGSILTSEALDMIPSHLLPKISVVDEEANKKVEKVLKEFKEALAKIEKKFESDAVKVKEGDDLSQSTLKIVKVIIASKQRLQAGDKMAGRHGNKGVVSRIVPVEDMPYMEDGTPIDMLLSPLGVPSRMNIGQILETHLGWASHELGKQIGQIIDSTNEKRVQLLREKINRIYKQKHEREYFDSLSDEDLLSVAENLRKRVPFATGAFEGITIKEIEEIMEEAGLPKSGQVKVIDGRTGEYFDRPITVGYKYMLKLHHLVDDKIHARATGPYSLITQQPLGGKSHFGGQRFGEMECWALQAYGAAYTLQEMLTVKSDDVIGRVKMYEAIAQGNQNFTCGLPESFNVMVKEVRSLGLNLELVKE